MKDRPAGIKVIAVFYLIFGVFSLLWSGLVLGVGGLSSLLGSLVGAQILAGFGNTSAWQGFLGLIAAGIQIVVGFGLLGMHKWAWYIALFGVGISVLQGVVLLFTGGLFGIICGSLSLIIPVIILIYLLSSGIRKTFYIGSAG
ncbi:MAG: hypothetical protein WBD56_00765 [Anaerolineales bacterium]